LEVVREHLRSIAAVERPYRIVVASASPDEGVDTASTDDDREAASWARTLRDAGFEVIYTDGGLTPDEVAEAALQEDADAVGWAATSGSSSASDVITALRVRGLDDVVVAGGEPAIPFDLVSLRERLHARSSGASRSQTPH
jgi:methylmalonyl-CoA mutase C-terminal domain/subunit